MKIRLIILIVTNICMAVLLHSQQEVYIHLKDKQTLESLPFANIYTVDDHYLTDENGITEISAGQSYTISYLGYKTKQLYLEFQTDTLEVYLSREYALLEMAVVTGNKTGERFLNAIAPLDIMPSLVSSSRSTTSLSSLVNRMPGIQIVDGQISIRGGAGYAYGAGSRVAVLMNGIPMIQADAGTISWADLPIELIERVEILKGSAATLYGSAALNGVLELHTWPFVNDTSFTHLLMATRVVGPPNDVVKQWYNVPRMSYWGHIAHKDLKGDFKWQGSLRYEDQENHLKDYLNTRYRASFMAKHQLNRQFEVGLQTLINMSENRSFLYWKDAGAGAFIGDTSALIHNEVLRWQIDPYLKYTTTEGNRHWLQGRIFYADNQSSGNRGSTVEQYLMQYQYAHNLWEGNALWLNGFTAQTFNSRAELFGERSTWAYNAAVYSKYEQTIFGKLKISAGGRIEYNAQLPGEIEFAGDTINADTEEIQPLFSAGINYEFSKISSLSYHFGQGYRFPTIAEKFVATSLGPTSISPNPSLHSEEGYSMNLSFKQGIQFGVLQSLFRFDLFWMQYDDMIEFGLRNPTLGFQALNIGDTDIKGIEVSYMGSAEWKQLQFDFLTGYTHIWPKYREFSGDIAARSSEDYNILKYRVRDQFTLQSQVLWKSWQLGVSGLYNSDMEAIDRLLEIFIVNGLEEYRARNAGEFIRWDISLEYQFNAFSLLLDVQNLFNVEYSLRPGLLEMPRNYSLQFEYHF